MCQSQILTKARLAFESTALCRYSSSGHSAPKNPKRPITNFKTGRVWPGCLAQTAFEQTGSGQFGELRQRRPLNHGLERLLSMPLLISSIAGRHSSLAPFELGLAKHVRPRRFLEDDPPPAEQNYPVYFARAATLRAINRNVEQVFNPNRKDPHWASGS
jgi:hypothetical protein